MRGHNRPQQVMALASEFIECIAIGSEHTLALTARGEVWGWGSNSDGQLGLGHTGTVREPQLITALSGKQVKQVSKCDVTRSEGTLVIFRHFHFSMIHSPSHPF